MKDYNELVRRSIRKDFAKANFKRNREPKTPHPKDTKRVVYLNERSMYYRYRHFILGKLVRLFERGTDGFVWVEFVNESDRVALNNAAGWTDKRRYLLDGAKFDD